MVKLLVLCAVVVAAAVGCSGGTDRSAETGTDGSIVLVPVADPTPPELPTDFTWTGRYVVPDLDVEVPFTWNGRGGDFQMVAGGEGETIHFTNLVVDGQLYTLTYEWPGVARQPCSHVGPFTVDELNSGLAKASFVGRETLHGDPDRVVDHFRSTSVLELPPGIVPALDDVTTLRLPLMAGDIYVDVDDNQTFWKVLHFGLQNLYDPDLDEWIVIDEVEPVAGDVTLPDECTPSSPPGQDAPS